MLYPCTFSLRNLRIVIVLRCFHSSTGGTLRFFYFQSRSSRKVRWLFGSSRTRVFSS